MRIHIFWLFAAIWFVVYLVREKYKKPFQEMRRAEKRRYDIINVAHIIAAVLAIIALLSDCGKRSRDYDAPPRERYSAPPHKGPESEHRELRKELDMKKAKWGRHYRERLHEEQEMFDYEIEEPIQWEERELSPR